MKGTCQKLQNEHKSSILFNSIAKRKNRMISTIKIEIFLIQIFIHVKICKFKLAVIAKRNQSEENQHQRNGK